MKLTSPRNQRRWTGLLLLLLGLGGCRPDGAAEQRLPNAPLWETLPAGYRPLSHRDTLASYWAPNSAWADSTFQLTERHVTRLLVRARFVPASALRRAGLDTLRFRPTASEFYVPERVGYGWYFFPGLSREPTVEEDAAGRPRRLVTRRTSRLALAEYRRYPDREYNYERNSYLQDYPFAPVAVARVGDSVAYFRVYALRAERPRPDTICTYYQNGRRTQRVPQVADEVDTTHLATVRFSFRPLPGPATSSPGKAGAGNGPASEK